MTRAYTVALTGGIASGKTVLANHFAQHGAVVIDADQISRQLTESDDDLRAALRRSIGPSYFSADGILDRRRLRLDLAHHQELRHCMETLLHPRIWDALAQAVAAGKTRWVLIVIPLLKESNRHWPIPIDRIVVVDCRAETQIRRLVARDGLTREEARSMLEIQPSRMERLTLADDLVINEDHSGDLAGVARSLAEEYAQGQIARDRPGGSHR